MTAVVGARPTAAPALAALRRATTAVHLRLHALPAFARIGAGTIALADYRALLARLYAYHAPLDAIFAARAADFAAHGLDIASRSRVAALAADLRALGAAPATIAAAPLAAAGWSVPALFGRLYVREGSTLGGRVLARQLDPLFGTRRDGRRFFAGDARGAAQWKETCAALEAVATTGHGALDDLVAGAIGGFESFERWMT